MEHLAAEGQHIFSLEFKSSTKTELERNITEYWRQIIEFLSVCWMFKQITFFQTCQKSNANFELASISWLCSSSVLKGQKAPTTLAVYRTTLLRPVSTQVLFLCSHVFLQSASPFLCGRLEFKMSQPFRKALMASPSLFFRLQIIFQSIRLVTRRLGSPDNRVEACSGFVCLS